MLHAVPPLPVDVPQAPARIVAGLYLRCLREARGIRLEDAAHEVGVPTAAVSSWEQSQSPIRQDAFSTLLRHYGVAGDETGFLVQSLPPQDYDRSQHEEHGEGWHAPYDSWADLAGDEATARHIAVMRSASEVIQYCVLVPASLRTQDYQQAISDTHMGLTPDEHVLGLPAWVHHVPLAEGQRRTVLLDETVLTRGRDAHPATVAGQLRYLAGLVEQESSHGRGLTIRILPLSEALLIHAVGTAAEVTLHGHRMVVRDRLFPSYETGSGTTRIISAGLHEAVGAAWSRDATYEALVSAAEGMERRAAS